VPAIETKKKPFVRSHPLSTLLAAREEDLRAALPNWSPPQASGTWRKSAPDTTRPPSDPPPSVDFGRLEQLPYVRFTAPSLARLCDALGLPEIDEMTGEHVHAFADFSRGGPLPGDLHVIERVSDLVRDRLAWSDPEQARTFLEADAARARARHEEALAAWREAGEDTSAPLPPPPLRIPLAAILELAKQATTGHMPLWLWSVRWTDG
jgi:hypothetical protein